jgi:hypothetical protein
MVYLFLSFEGIQDLGPHVAHVLVGIHRANDSMGSVVFQNGNGLFVVSLQSLCESRRGIILALHQKIPRFIVLHGIWNWLSTGIQFHRLGWGVLDMVRATRILVDPTPSDALFQNRVGNFQFNHLGDTRSFLSQHLVKSLGLWQRTNPSKMNPNRQSGSLMRSRMIPTTISSLTSPPAFMTASAFFPTSVPAETAARNMSPVESCGMPNKSSILGPCVPFPAPGGPLPTNN